MEHWWNICVKDKKVTMKNVEEKRYRNSAQNEI